MIHLRPWAVIVVLAVAGCLSPSADDAAASTSTTDAAILDLIGFDPMAQGGEHDHYDIASHTHAWQFEQTDWEALTATSERSAGLHALDVRDGWLFAAVWGGDADDEGGFFILDAHTDPADPQVVGRFQFPGTLSGDRSMEANDDATFAVLGTESVDSVGHVSAAPAGLYLVDISDKAAPELVAFEKAEGIGGVHSVTIHRIDGEDYVFALTGGQNIFHIDTSGPLARLVRVGSIPIGHDSVVMDDPVLGIPILYAANGGAGFTITDVSDPTNPQRLAEWNIPDREDKYYIHTGAVRFIEDRRVVVVSTEDWQDYPSAFWALDMSDFEDIQNITMWQNPGGVAAQDLRFSMHNPRFMGDTLVLSHYHGGVWAFDFSSLEAIRAHTITGVFLPGEDTGWVPKEPTAATATEQVFFDFDNAATPLAFDVEAGDGVVYVADVHSGLYTIKPTWS